LTSEFAPEPFAHPATAPNACPSSCPTNSDEREVFHVI
jgi:hypothetical protein